MRRALAFLVRNWPLKLAAVLMAVVLYAGVVVSENTRSWPGQVPITVVDPPAGGVVLTTPGAVTALRYRAPLEVAGSLRSDSFRATLDLSGITPEAGGPTVDVPVELIALDPRVQVVEYSPRSVPVRVDTVTVRALPVTVERGAPPEGFVLGPPQTDPGTVVLRGASSRLAAVHSVLARVPVDASGLNIDQVVDLEAVDESGNLVPGIEITPAQAQVRMNVARQLAYATLPVVPAVTGTPAAGHRIAGVTVDPPTVTVSGEAPSVERLASVSTAPIPVDGLDADRSTTVALQLPPEVSVIGGSEVRVHVAVEPVQGSRTIAAGLALQGARRDRTTTLSTDQVLVTLAGPEAALEALAVAGPGALLGVVDVAGLANGRHELPITVTPPEGLEVVSIAPRTVVARIAAPDGTPVLASPAPSPASSTAPSPAALRSGSDAEALTGGTTATGPAGAVPSPSVRPSGSAAPVR
ncbi:MAG: CdaR family protein [Chloroflexota bacterium]